MVFALLLIYVCTQGYWVARENGNVVVYSVNSSNLEEIRMGILIDGDTILLGTQKNQYLNDIKRTSMFKMLGRHELEVIVWGGAKVQTKESFIVLGVRWINVEFIDELDGTNGINHYKILVSTDSKPIVFE